MVVICTSLMINHVEHLFFMCLLAMCVSSFGKCLFGYCANFLNWVLFFIEYQFFDMSFFDMEYELYKKDLHDTDSHDGVITHLEPDIWSLKSSGT